MTRILFGVSVLLFVAACGGPIDCAPGEVPNDVLQACVIPARCDGGTANERNECASTQATTAEDGGSGGAGGGARQAGPDAGAPANGGSGGEREASGGAGGREGVAGNAGGSEEAGSAAPSGPRCGDGKVDPNEACDGNCKTSCPPPVGCVGSELKGSASNCDVECAPTTISIVIDGDGCCPMGATYATDMDCPRSCGDGKLASDEKCEPGSTDHPCPTAKDCDDGDPCTLDTVAGTAQQCTAQCVHMPMTREAADCDDGDPCTDDMAVESATECKFTCMHSTAHQPTGSCVDSDPCTDDTPVMSKTQCAFECPHNAMQPPAANCADDDACTDDTPVMSKTQCIFECPHKKIGTARTYFPDCDGDGYAPQSTGMQACSEPALAGGCAWTERAPTANATDCDDRNDARHPGADLGLPISRTGQQLPPAGDQAYDLDCDGVLTKGSAATLSTGLIKQGKLELVELCGATSSCSPGGPVCVMSFPVTGGSSTCGEPYPTQTICGGSEVDVYFLCR